jgi:hypothetical protein
VPQNHFVSDAMSVRIYHNPLGSADFITDLLVQGGHPYPQDVTFELLDLKNTYDLGGRWGDHHTNIPCFTVVQGKMHYRPFSGNNRKADVYICELVLIDGSGTLFKAATSSNLSDELNCHSFSPGSFLKIYKYNIFWLKEFESHEFRFVMLIKEMESSTPSLSQRSITLKREELEWVATEGLVIFTVPLVSGDGNERSCMRCNWNELKHGDWILNPTTVCDWQDFIAPKLSESKISKNWFEKLPPPIQWDFRRKAYDIPGPNTPCRCVTEFGFPGCIRFIHGVDHLNKYDIFRGCAMRLEFDWNVNRSSWKHLNQTQTFLHLLVLFYQHIPG